MSWMDEMNRRYQMASYQEAERKGEQWKWFAQKIIFSIVKFIVVFPIRVIWEWTGRRTNSGVAHFAQFAFFLALFYFVVFAIIAAPFMK